MATTRSGWTGIGLKVAGPVVMVAALLADQWLPAGQPDTVNLQLVLLGLLAMIAGFSGWASALVSGGILLAADFYSLFLSAGTAALSSAAWIHLFSLLLAIILIVLPVGLRKSAPPMVQEPMTSRDEHPSPSTLRRIDVVTGLLTRHFVMSMAQVEWERWRRYATPFSLLMVEIEGLNALRRSNPAQADALLRVLANRTTSSLRAMDVASRIDDARLLILLPQTNETGALVAGKKLLKALQHARMGDSGDNQAAHVRIAAAGVYRSDDHLHQVVNRVEEALRTACEPGFDGVASVEPNVSGQSFAAR
jgi:diguanylate cyclase (GGDEF)-like protein